MINVDLKKIVDLNIIKEKKLIEKNYQIVGEKNTNLQNKNSLKKEIDGYQAKLRSKSNDNLEKKEKIIKLEGFDVYSSNQLISILNKNGFKDFKIRLE